MNKLFGYMGSKQKYIDIINSKINESDKKVYTEPFLGSGSIFINLTRQFDKYYISENQKDILNIFKWMPQITVKFAKEYFNKVKKDIDYNTKQGFYEFREYWNNTLRERYNELSALGLIILITNSINNMARFGPNGYNQSYGSRYLTDFKKKRIFNTIKYLGKIKDKIEYFNDYKDCIESLHDSVIFVDPPYYLAPMYTCNWDEKDTKNMLDELNLEDNNVIYTDIENPYGNTRFKNKIELKKTKKGQTNPTTGKRKKLLNEIMYFNF